VTILAAFMSSRTKDAINCVFRPWRLCSSCMEGSSVVFASEDRWQSRGHAR